MDPDVRRAHPTPSGRDEHVHRTVVDHVVANRGTVPDYEPFDDTGLLQADVGTVADARTTAVRELDVTASVRADVAAGRTRSLFRFRFAQEGLPSAFPAPGVAFNTSPDYTAPGGTPATIEVLVRE